MDILKLLEKQHKEVDALVAKIEKAKQTEAKNELFIEMADKLAAHAACEEKLFYPTVQAKSTEDILRESVEEHLSVKRVLADMLEMDADDEQFDAKLSVLKEQLEHHAHEEEEGELFPKVKKLFDKDELEALGSQFEEMFNEVLETEPRLAVPGETDQAAPI